jgi:hypothetical protein
MFGKDVFGRGGRGGGDEHWDGGWRGGIEEGFVEVEVEVEVERFFAALADLLDEPVLGALRVEAEQVRGHESLEDILKCVPMRNCLISVLAGDRKYIQGTEPGQAQKGTRSPPHLTWLGGHHKSNNQANVQQSLRAVCG